jgi:hypothetical protein
MAKRPNTRWKIGKKACLLWQVLSVILITLSVMFISLTLTVIFRFCELFNDADGIETNNVWQSLAPERLHIFVERAVLCSYDANVTLVDQDLVFLCCNPYLSLISRRHSEARVAPSGPLLRLWMSLQPRHTYTKCVLYSILWIIGIPFWAS